MSLVSLAFQPPCAVLTLNRPGAANALSRALVADLRAALGEAVAAGPRAVVLHGAGKAFCAGADLGELAVAPGGAPTDRLAAARALGALYGELLRCPAITLAAVSGAAFGGGVGLAAACDVAVAAPDSRWQLSELRLGFVPALVGVFLGRRLSPARLGGLLLHPAPLDGPAAVASGLADEVAEHPLDRALHLAESMARAVSPDAVARTKAWLLEQALPDLDHRLDRAARLNASQQEAPQCRWGIGFFSAQRRFPDWLDDFQG